MRSEKSMELDLLMKRSLTLILRYPFIMLDYFEEVTKPCEIWQARSFRWNRGGDDGAVGSWRLKFVIRKPARWVAEPEIWIEEVHLNQRVKGDASRKELWRDIVNMYQPKASRKDSSENNSKKKIDWDLVKMNYQEPGDF